MSNLSTLPSSSTTYRGSFFRPTRKRRPEAHTFTYALDSVSDDPANEYLKGDSTHTEPKPRRITRATVHKFLTSLPEAQRKKLDYLTCCYLTCNHPWAGGVHGSWWWGYGIRIVSSDLLRRGVSADEVEVEPWYE